MTLRFSAWPVWVMLVLASIWGWLVLFAADPVSLHSDTAGPTEAREVAGGVEVATDDASPRRAVGQPSAPAEETRPLAPSLRDTEVDGAMRTGPGGGLIEDRGLRRLFDYLLAAASETPIEALRARLESMALEQGGSTLASQVLAAFDRYVAYLRAASALNSAGHVDRRSQLAALIDLRRRMLGSVTADAYFGEEERYALALLDEDVPLDPQHAAWRTQATEHQRALEQTAQFDHMGLDASQRWAEREALYGAEAADRLASLDAEQRAWDARFDRFRDLRANVLANASLDAAARSQAIEQLLLEHFSEPERRRVRALMEAQPDMP